jgi:thiosulfate dehydrogenase (quinone) large subunit
MTRFTRSQAVSLVLLRTLIGWHFLYEGYYKLALPAWSATGQPLGHWSAAGYLRAATGPLAGVFHSLAGSRFVSWVDLIVPVALVVVGLSLTLGLFTRLGCWGAVTLLTLFYLAAVPTTGAPVTGQEGTYLLVSKNVIELVAVIVVLSCHTERIAGLDLLFTGRSASVEPVTPAHSHM